MTRHRATCLPDPCAVLSPVVRASLATVGPESDADRDARIAARMLAGFPRREVDPFGDGHITYNYRRHLHANHAHRDGTPAQRAERAAAAIAAGVAKKRAAEAAKPEPTCATCGVVVPRAVRGPHCHRRACDACASPHELRRRRRLALERGLPLPPLPPQRCEAPGCGVVLVWDGPDAEYRKRPKKCPAHLTRNGAQRRAHRAASVAQVAA